jgi:hypothetical protein
MHKCSIYIASKHKEIEEITLDEKIKNFLIISSNSSSNSSDSSGSNNGFGDSFSSGSSSNSSSSDSSGSGDGFSNSFGSGSSDSSGDGSGSSDGSGSGNGFGDGFGSGDGSGSGIKSFNEAPVYRIDGVNTLIRSVRNNTAHGAIMNEDLTLTPCYIVKQENVFAHGETLREAMEALHDKLFENMPEDERIAMFLRETDREKTYPTQYFYN